MTARMSVRRLPPPGFAGGINGSTCAHSSSVRSLGYLRRSRLYFGRFSCVHIGGLSANQPAFIEITNDSIDSRSFKTDTKDTRRNNRIPCCISAGQSLTILGKNRSSYFSESPNDGRTQPETPLADRLTKSRGCNILKNEITK